MTRIAYYVRRDNDGTFAGEGVEDGNNVTLASIQSRLPAGLTALDSSKAARPPEAPAMPDPLKTKYASASTIDAKLDVIAERLGLLA